MYLSHLFSISLLSFTLLLSTCKTIVQSEQESSETEDVITSTEESIEGSLPGKPYFGFNSKSNLKPNQQIALADAFFKSLPPDVRSNLVIRLPGGTLSQKVYSSDFPDDIMMKWTKLQKDYGIRLIYVVNGNDTPNNQKHLIERWMSHGAQFDFIEMMNEYYLPKFVQGKTEKAEVTRPITPELYVNEILPEFFETLDGFGLPYFVICAPNKEGKPGQRMKEWNDVMVEALTGKFANRDLGIVIHLYKKTLTGPYDYAQINELRNRISPNTKVAITEMGILDESATQSTIGGPIKSHYTKIFRELGEGDYLFDQVLYNNYKGSTMATLHPSANGLTKKGEKVVELLKEVYP